MIIDGELFLSWSSIGSIEDCSFKYYIKDMLEIQPVKDMESEITLLLGSNNHLSFSLFYGKINKETLLSFDNFIHVRIYFENILKRIFGERLNDSTVYLDTLTKFAYREAKRWVFLRKKFDEKDAVRQFFPVAQEKLCVSKIMKTAGYLDIAFEELYKDEWSIILGDFKTGKPHPYNSYMNRILKGMKQGKELDTTDKPDLTDGYGIKKQLTLYKLMCDEMKMFKLPIRRIFGYYTSKPYIVGPEEVKSVTITWLKKEVNAAWEIIKKRDFSMCITKDCFDCGYYSFCRKFWKYTEKGRSKLCV